MYQEFITQKLDATDTEARTPLRTIWKAFIDQCVGGHAVHTARLRDLEAAIRSAGYPVGTVCAVKYVGGLRPLGAKKRHWIVTEEGKLKLANAGINRERGQAEADCV